MHRYDAAALADLYGVHSADRLRSYVATSGALADAFDLYVWNTVLASRLHGSLQAVEVGLRNACDRELTAYFGPSWYSDPTFLTVDPDLRGRIKAARSSGAARGNIIANLTFFFWTKLFDPILPVWLWNNVVRHVLPGAAPRSVQAIHAELEKLRDLRNAVAHLEALHGRNITDDVNRIERVCSWIHPTLESWVRDYNAVTVVSASRPVPNQEPARGLPPWPLRTF
jgi:hypothetical protein